MKNRLAFLLSSCDAYADTWDIFFDLMNIYWPDIQYTVYLNTETIPYSPKNQYPFGIKVLNTSAKYQWSKRMLKVLEQIDEEYVLLVLDDFFIKSKANVDVIEALLDIMDNDHLIASCQLTASRIAQEQNITISNELSMNLMPKEGWKTHFIPTVWRKSILKKWLRAHETIWAFELRGSQRARRWNYKEKVYTIDSPVVYDYTWMEGVSAIVNGRWFASPLLDKFFEDSGITVDFSKRGRITMEEYRERAKAKSILSRYSFGQIIVKSFNLVRSLI